MIESLNSKNSIMDTNIIQYYKSATTNIDNVDSSPQLTRDDSGILTDLLKSFKDNERSSDDDSGNYYNECSDERSKFDYKSLIDAMSECKITTNNLNDFQKVSNSDPHNKNGKNLKTRDKCDIQKNNNKTNSVITLQVKIKKKNLNKLQNSKDIETPINSDNSIEKILNVMSRIDLNDNRDQKLKINEKYCLKENKEKRLENIPKTEKDKKKKIILIERGPIRNSFDNVKLQTPYEKQIHRKFLSGGTVIEQKYSPEIDIIPSTVNFEKKEQNHLLSSIEKNNYNDTDNSNISKYDELKNIVNQLKKDEHIFISNKKEKLNNDFFDWNEDLGMLMEILQGDQNQRQFVTFQDESIEKSINNDSKNEISFSEKPKFQIDTYNENDDKIVPSPSDFNDVSILTKSNIDFTLPSISQTNNMDENYLSISNTDKNKCNLSPYSRSPYQGFQSPSIENVEYTFFENTLLYENTKSSISSSSKESYNSPLSESPSSQNNEGVFIYTDNSLNQNISMHLDYCLNPSPVNSEPCKNNISSSFESSSLSNFSPISDTIIEYNHIYKSPEYIYNETNVYSEEESQTYYSDISSTNINILNDDSISPISNVQFLDCNKKTKNNFLVDSSSKNLKKKLTPIVCKEMFPCCVDYKKSAKQVLEEMFNRLDDKMRKIIYLEVHGVNDDKLTELFDGQLSSWNDNIGMQYPRFALLHITCERLLMRSKTMAKFFDVYINGHTLLDRAILTCSQSPLVVKYLAECMLRALPHLPHDNDLILDKADISGNTILHRGAGRGEQCATALASLLSINDSFQTTIFNVNRLNSDGSTPLHIACSRHTVVNPGGSCPCQIIVHVLLEHGHANPNIKDGRSGNTALHLAVDASVCAPDLVTILLKYGANPSIRNYSGATPLDFARTASRSTNRPQYPKQVVDILKKLK